MNGVKAQRENGKVSKENNVTENKELVLQLETQISIANWIQFIGQTIEAINLSRIMLISEEVRENANERHILLGAWLQSVGQFLIGIGVTQQILVNEEAVATIKAQEITNFGDWIKTLGSTVVAEAGRQIIIEEKKELEPPILIQ